MALATALVKYVSLLILVSMTLPARLPLVEVSIHNLVPSWLAMVSSQGSLASRHTHLERLGLHVQDGTMSSNELL